MAKSFLRTAFDRVIEARERQVSRHVNAALLNLDDKSLEALGMNRAELRRPAKSSYVF